MKVNVSSEIGKLNGVLIHTPGPEVENMTPENAERALYSDILNLTVAQKEYQQFIDVLNKVTTTYEVSDLLMDVLDIPEAKKNILENICKNEKVDFLKDYFHSLDTKELAWQLIEGVPLEKDTLTKFMSKEKYALLPLHNLFFTRDPSISIGNEVLIAKMSSTVRAREALIMDSVFRYHPQFAADTMNPMTAHSTDDTLAIEGGDVIVAREDLLCIGTGARTTTQGIDFLLDTYKAKKRNIDIIVQELPTSPESFIHLDMIFTFLDKDCCLCFEPALFNIHSYQTVHIKIDNGKVKWIREERNILEALKKEGIDLKPVACGGNSDEWIQEREQWHIGANVFAFAPGKVIAYGRNNYTVEALNKNGFEVVDFPKLENLQLDDYNKCVVTIDGSELARGGGGCRCMTMPVNREKVDW